FSQMLHEGEYPEYDNGGEAWCSPTSTSMVLAYYNALPRPKAYAWVDSDYRDRFVDHAARMTFDYSFEGTGNWPFNTAYAASRTGGAFVTRLRNLRDAERFIAAGIPVVASIAFGKGELTGAPISSTDGHLLVIVGFTANGDVVVNDPAAPTSHGVRRTYDRGQLEAAWLNGSGGVGYVISDAAHPLPPGTDSSPW
ncbi:MAG TPA: peptidase C39 family protein, partial [Nocardioidaceae bacterium]|nr:peptidase C39 family protein [Nocardioidaceae bacterium]